MKYLSVVLLPFMLATAVVADPWSGRSEIVNIYPAKEGLHFISSYKNAELSTCDGGGRYLIPIGHPNYAVLTSSLLAAFMAEKEINFKLESNQEKTCSPIVNRFHVYK